MSPLTFVMFHVFAGGPDAFRDMIGMAAKSVNNVYPSAQIILLTNLGGEELGLPDYVATSPIEKNLESLMLDRIRQYRAFLGSYQRDGYVVLMDTDMLLLRSIDEQLQDDFDIGLTLRNFRKAPINGGLYLINMKHKARATRFFDRLLEVYATLPVEEQRWDGDQSSLARMLDPPAAKGSGTVHSNWEGIRIKYLPVSKYNNTPRRLLLNNIVYQPSAKLLHLKGPRKAAMPQYFERYVDSWLGRLIRGF